MILNAIIEKDKDGYFAYIPSLKGCFSQGDSYEEVIYNITEATKLYSEDMKVSEIKKLIQNQISITPIEINLDASSEKIDC